MVNLANKKFRLKNQEKLPESKKHNTTLEQFLTGSREAPSHEALCI